MKMIDWQNIFETESTLFNGSVKGSTVMKRITNPFAEMQQIQRL
jgi:hypothetical protein